MTQLIGDAFGPVATEGLINQGNRQLFAVLDPPSCVPDVPPVPVQQQSVPAWLSAAASQPVLLLAAAGRHWMRHCKVGMVVCVHVGGLESHRFYSLTLRTAIAPPVWRGAHSHAQRPCSVRNPLRHYCAQFLCGTSGECSARRASQWASYAMSQEQILCHPHPPAGILLPVLQGARTLGACLYTRPKYGLHCLTRLPGRRAPICWTT